MYDEKAYRQWPHRSPEGVWDENHRHRLTRGLFIEMWEKGDENSALYTLHHEERVWSATGRMYPSAARIYVNATDEYDALRKLVGEVEQWETLKATVWFQPYIEKWHKEWAMLQRSMMLNKLRNLAMTGQPGAVTAARTIIAELNKNPVGRPRKEKPDTVTPMDEDHNRIVEIFSQRA